MVSVLVQRRMNIARSLSRTTPYFPSFILPCPFASFSQLFSTYLHISYQERQKVKDLGGKYDPLQKKWYVPSNLPLEPFEPWIREYLQVPYHQKDQVKKLGAQWDFHTKRWFVQGSGNLSKFNEWRVLILKIPEYDIEKAMQLGAKYHEQSQQYYIPYQLPNKSDFLPWLPRLYLEVPQKDYQIIQNAGAIWDNSLQKWYLYAGSESLESELLKRYYHPTPSREPSPDLVPPSSSSTIPHYDITAPAKEPSPAMTPPKTLKLLFFDVETSGLPRLLEPDDTHSWKSANRYPPHTSLTAYESSRVVQLSYLLCSFPSMEEITSHDSIIQCSDFAITNSHIHGITTEISLAQGIPFPIAIQEFISHCHAADYLLAHNLPFDYHILLSELYRHQLHKYVNEFQRFPMLCTMELSKKYLAEKHGVTPSLKNLYENVMGERITGHHNSMSDVKNLFQVTKKLIEMEVIQLR